MGDRPKQALRVQLDGKLKLEFHGTEITSDASLLAFRELEGAFRLTDRGSPVLSHPPHAFPLNSAPFSYLTSVQKHRHRIGSGIYGDQIQVAISIKISDLDSHRQSIGYTELELDRQERHSVPPIE